MPKMKTNRGAHKRFKRNGAGNLIRGRANRRHILTKKATKRKRQLRASRILTGGDAKLVERLLPYS